MILLLLAVAAAFRVPKAVDSALVRRQWIPSNNHEKVPCVAVDAYTRHGHELYVLLIGTCGGLIVQRTVCEVESEGAFDTRKARGIQKAPFGDGRQKTSSFGRTGEMLHQWMVDCGKIEQAGQVSLYFGATEITNITFTPATHRPRPGIAVCSRLYDTMGWPPMHTVMLLEWLEWQLAIGVDTIHMYVHSLESPKIWTALAPYLAEGRMVIHVWSDETEDDVVKRTWELAQISHLADCFLRLEGEVRYIAPLDHDEFLNPRGGLLGPALDHYFALNPQASNVVSIEPVTAIPDSCDADDDALYVTSFCTAHANAYGKNKYIVRTAIEHPVLLFPTIHKASDDRPTAFIKTAALRLVHIGRFSQFNARAGKHIDAWWNVTIGELAAEKLKMRGAGTLTAYSQARDKLDV